jgi:hypothetical protein
MPASLTYPGVNIDELSSGVRTITGFAMSITAFVGCVLRGPSNKAVRVQSFATNCGRTEYRWAKCRPQDCSMSFEHPGTPASDRSLASSMGTASELCTKR